MAVKEKIGVLVVDLCELEEQIKDKKDFRLDLMVASLKSQINDFETALDEFNNLCKVMEGV